MIKLFCQIAQLLESQNRQKLLTIKNPYQDNFAVLQFSIFAKNDVTYFAQSSLYAITFFPS